MTHKIKKPKDKHNIFAELSVLKKFKAWIINPVPAITVPIEVNKTIAFVRFPDDLSASLIFSLNLFIELRRIKGPIKPMTIGDSAVSPWGIFLINSCSGFERSSEKTPTILSAISWWSILMRGGIKQIHILPERKYSVLLLPCGFLEHAKLHHILRDCIRSRESYRERSNNVIHQLKVKALTFTMIVP